MLATTVGVEVEPTRAGTFAAVAADPVVVVDVVSTLVVVVLMQVILTFMDTHTMLYTTN